MKNLPLFVCFLFCQEILAGNSIARYARKMRLSIEDVTECVEHADISFEMERQDSLEHNAKLKNSEANVRKYGCFMACLWQKRGMMTGSTLDMQKVMEHIDAKHPDNVDVSSFLHKTIETCASLVENMDDECEVALTFKTCLKEARRNRT